MKKKIKYLLPILVVLVIFAAVFVVRLSLSGNKPVLTYDSVLKAHDKAAKKILTGKRANKSAKQLGIPTGFYDIKVLSGSAESFPTMQITKEHSGKSILIKPEDTIRFSANSKISLTPSNLSPLESDSITIDSPTNLIVGKQIPAGTYEIINRGEWTKYDAKIQKPTQVALKDINWKGDLYDADKESGRGLDISTFENYEKEGKKPIIELKNKTLLSISFFYQNPDTAIELKAVKKS